MPTYEYECRTCGHSFERTQNMSDEPVKECPKCGKDVRRLIFGGSGVIFKGTGFYVNDSRGKKATGSTKSASTEDSSRSDPVKPDSGTGEASPAAKTASETTAAKTASNVNAGTPAASGTASTAKSKD